MITWLQLGIHRKALGVLNVGGFYDGLLALVEHAIQEGFVPERDRRLILEAADPGTLLDLVLSYEPPAASNFKWLQRNQT
jgi:predicted Rossmann-fold nucleotide-binding protein